MFKTKILYVPHGVGDVLNTHILDSVRLRIRALRSSPAPGQPPTEAAVANADRLEDLLLHGAPTVQEQAAREAAFAELPVGCMAGARPCRWYTPLPLLARCHKRRKNCLLLPQWLLLCCLRSSTHARVAPSRS